jgi:ELWxxDGT repeat protein
MDINTGTGGADSSNPFGFTALGDFLYFSAYDATHGWELWRTNGTTTELVMDINTGTGGADSSFPSGLTALGDFLYFNADDVTHGSELWRTNGTTTELVMDINTGTSGADSSNPGGFTALGDFLYFRADDGTHGVELWRTNGTTTELVQDIRSGAFGSSPYAFTALGDFLYFSAYDGTDGNLWRVSAAGTIESASPAGTNVSFGCMCERPILTLDGRLFAAVTTDETGYEFAYLDEPTYVLPPTNRDGSLWTATLVILAGLTAAASIGLRLRGARRA